MARLLAIGSIVAAATFGALVASASTPDLIATAEAADKDCSDFSSQRQAQRFFRRHGGPQRDPHRLDGDGRACEKLLCPCGTGGGGGGGGGGGNKPRRDNKTAARIREVVDGDTVKVRTEGRRKTVRLIGIDTPEVYGGTECGGPQASRSMKRMLHRGERIKLVRDRSQDNRHRYGRLLRYIEDGRKDVGRAQVGRGWGKVVKFDGRFKRISSYRKAQRRAKARSRGVWGRCGGNFHRRL